MKNKLFLLAGCIAVMIAAFAFVGCEKKNSSNALVGTWVCSEYSEYYGWETQTIVFKKNGKGTMTYEDGDGDRSNYDLKYTFNDDTDRGTITLTYTDLEYHETYSYTMDFKVYWHDKNTVTFYVRDYDYYYYYDEWEEMGVFRRQ